jgi:hypothetical protein
LLALCFLGCEKTAVSSTEKSIVGTWQLETYCKANGTTECSTVKVPKNVEVLIEFKKNNDFDETYTNTKPFEYAFLGCGPGNYAVEGEAVRIRAACMSSINGALFPIIELTNNKLVLKMGNSDYVFKKI